MTASTMTGTVDHTEPDLVPDLGDPTAGLVAQARETASAQVQLIADPAPLGLRRLRPDHLPAEPGELRPDAGGSRTSGLRVALAYGGATQLLAGMWEFKKGNVFGATVFSSYGAFWLSFWAYLTLYAEGIPLEQHGVAAGWFLICWAIF